MFRRAASPNGSVSWRERLRRFSCEDAGQDMIEYALIAALMGLMCAAALSPVAQALNNGVEKVNQKFKKHTHSDNGKHLGWFK